MAALASASTNVHQDFLSGLSPEGLAFFNDVCARNFADQATSFLNAVSLDPC
jgi:hypothetical protein